MRTGAPRHPKVTEMMSILKLKRYAVVGLLEMLWQFTADFAPRGDIGKHSDTSIAEAMAWDGKIDALMSALIGRWIDQDEEHRLVVHDWHEHAPEYVRKKLKRSGQWFAIGPPDDGQDPVSDRKKSAKVRSVTGQCPPTQGRAAQSRAEQSGGGGSAAQFPAAAAAVCERFPATDSDKLAEIFSEVLAIVPDACDSEIAAGVPSATKQYAESAAMYKKTLPPAVKARHRGWLERQLEATAQQEREQAENKNMARRILADPDSTAPEREWALGFMPLAEAEVA